MKRLLYLAAISLFALSCSNMAEEGSGVYDTRAVEVLDSLSLKIGTLESASYTLNTINIKQKEAGEPFELINEHDVYMRGPDKMHIHTKGTRGEKSYWYNGSTFSYYSYTNNTYDKMEAPSNILKVIDALHDKYGIDFPAADFFYPSLTDDILENFDKLIFWGKSQIGDKEYYSLSAYNTTTTVQIWIDSNTHLPAKIVHIEEGEMNGVHYEATFSNWKINPNLPDLLFEFEAPKGAIKTSLQPKK